MKQKKFLMAQMLIFLFILLSFNIISAQENNKPRKCILVFGAHADDVESIAGGTFAKYIAMGYEGIYVGAINNLAGCNLERTPYFKGAPLFTISNSPNKYPVDALETSQIREEEALQAAAVFKATPVFLNFNEPWFSMGRKQIDYGTKQYVEFSPAGRRLISLATIVSSDVNVVCDLLRKYQPEIVITHTLGGEKLDHGNAAYLVDVKDFLKIKYAAYDKHVSQNGGFGRDYVLSNRKKPYNDEVEEFITVIDNTK